MHRRFLQLWPHRHGTDAMFAAYLRRTAESSRSIGACTTTVRTVGLRIMPSLLSADFANLQSAIESIPSADALHVDVMDNHFVPT